MSRRLLLSMALLTLIPSWSQAQRKEALIVFKDGFFISGKVVEKREILFDPTGAHVSIPLQGGLISLDDYVRRIFFIPGQLQDVLERKFIEHDFIELKRPKYTTAPKNFLLPWELESYTPWNDKWERTLTVQVTDRLGRTGKDEMTQRIVQLTPRFICIQTGKWNWDLFYQTKEFGVQEVRSLLGKYLAEKKELKEFDKRLMIAKFINQVGWHGLAEKELDSLAIDYPTQADAVNPLRDKLKKLHADLAAETIERLYKVGQHEEAQDRLTTFTKENLAALADPKNLLLTQDIKNKYDEGIGKLAKLRSALKELPTRMTANRAYWTRAADLILDELHFDNQGRLDTFAVFAQQHLRELDDKQKPTQTSEDVMALAVTGWLQGNAAAEPDAKMARLLLRARTAVLEHQKSDQQVARVQALQSFLKGAKDKEGEVPIDVLARLIRLLPPPVAYDKSKLDTDPITLEVEAPDANGGSYVVRLPPEYHHGRPYPVLMVLHAAREKPDAALKRWTELAAEHGFILVAPTWGSGFNATYGYGDREHAVVLDCLRDLRRRFQVDSDRVFLFGFEQGAVAAMDIGMSHPDQFAGVLPMCFNPRYYPEKCWSNAQFLHMYLVDGDRSGNAKSNRDLFKEWVRCAYPALYMEYKGRSLEFYYPEMPTMFDWMSRKKRHFPTRDLGRYNSAGVGEEFKTMRPGEQRFYWLGTDSISENCINSPNAWGKTIRPATLQGNISVGNEAKAGGKDAKIWNHINLRSSGVKQLTLWLAPNMIDFTKPTLIRVNSTQQGLARVIPPDPVVMLEDFNHWGDRQRLFFAKVDLRP